MAARRTRRALPRGPPARRLGHAARRELPARPLALLATAVPRLISLAVAANVLHILPATATSSTTLADELLSTLDQTAAGSLRRCHLALIACRARRPR